MQGDLSQRQRRIRFERELLGICLPVGQRDRFQNTIKIENKSRSYKARSDEGHGRFWEQTVLLSGHVMKQGRLERHLHPTKPKPQPMFCCCKLKCFEFPPSRMTANSGCHAL